MIQHPSFRVEPWSLHETALNLDVLAQTESLFALSNGHIGAARQSRRGRAARAARLLPQRLLRAASAAVRREPVRRAGVEPDAHQRDQRQAHPAARRRRAVRRSLRPPAAPTIACSTSAPAR